MNSPLLQGPCRVPAGATHALICLHGFGADGNDLMGLIPPLDAALGKLAETLAVFCPNAPTMTDMGQGYQWFSPAGWTFKDKPGIARAAAQVEAFIEAEVVTKLGIGWDKVVVLGFSQGAMTVLYAAPRWAQKVGGVVAHSGCAMWQEELDGATCQKPPVLVLHGQEDDVVPADQSLAAASGLQALGFDVEVHILPGLGHGFDMRSLAHMAVFMKEKVIGL